MINSRDIALLRDDVEANCRVFIDKCKAAGLNVLITQTLRDNEYQATLYAQGRTKPGSIVTNSKTTTFHGVGLAFDIAKNVKGHEYDDLAFFSKCAVIAKEIGFSWGGDWKTFVDRPHFQWDNHGKAKYTSVPTMPLYKTATEPKREDEEEMDISKLTDADVLALAQRMQTLLGRQEQTGTMTDELQKAVAAGITDGTNPRAFATRAQAAVMVQRALEAAKK